MDYRRAGASELAGATPNGGSTRLALAKHDRQRAMGHPYDTAPALDREKVDRLIDAIDALDTLGNHDYRMGYLAGTAAARKQVEEIWAVAVHLADSLSAWPFDVAPASTVEEYADIAGELLKLAVRLDLTDPADVARRFDALAALEEQD